MHISGIFSFLFVDGQKRERIKHRLPIERMATACDASTLEAKRIQQNSAEAALEQATKEYTSCLPLNNRIEIAFEKLKPTTDAMMAEVNQLGSMSKFLIKQLRSGNGDDPSVQGGIDLAKAESKKLQDEIDDLKGEIRKERRRFLDSDPQGSPAIAGLYFMKVPDNQVLIAFLSCLGALLLFVSLLVFLNQIPVPYFQALQSGERVKIIALLWIATILLTFVGLNSFT
jgi:hypothetical protein